MSTLEITKKFAGAEGSSIVTGPRDLEEPQGPAESPAKIRLTTFMLEDYIDSVEAHAALQDPENAQRLPWAQLREELGL
jgi:hypothetical protein